MDISLNPQGSDEWFLDRFGQVTASNFQRVLAPRGRRTYFDELVDYRSRTPEEVQELIKGPRASTQAMEHGNLMEPRARAYYELATGSDVREVGFISIGGELPVGASVDGLVDPDGTIEIKCPFNIANHIETIKNGMPVKHMAQVQGGLWVTNRLWCDFVSYCPDYPAQDLYVQRVVADSGYIAMLSERVTEFARRLRDGVPLHDEEQPGAVPALF